MDKYTQIINLLFPYKNIDIQHVLFLKDSEIVRYMPIQELAIYARTKNALLRAGIFYLDQLLVMSYDDLIQIQGVGNNSIEQLLQDIKPYVKVTNFIFDGFNNPIDRRYIPIDNSLYKQLLHQKHIEKKSINHIVNEILTEYLAENN